MDPDLELTEMLAEAVRGAKRCELDTCLAPYFLDCPQCTFLAAEAAVAVLKDVCLIG